MNLTVAIPTYGRDRVLINTILSLMQLHQPPWELLILDQTKNHDVLTHQELSKLDFNKKIHWIRLTQPSITGAMNTALVKAKGDRILFLDDDIIPDPDLLYAHSLAGIENPVALIAGRVLQPWHNHEPDSADAPFHFNSLIPRAVREFMGGNFSLAKEQAIQIGGFDENFVRVAYRFEAEFAARWRRSGYPIFYQPNALIHHLKADRGGTRSFGFHLTTHRPDHSVGRYYFRFRTQSLYHAITFCGLDVLLSVRTRHHLQHPWWIPITIFAELKGLLWALWLYLKGPSYLHSTKPRVLIVGSHPIQYQTPLFKALDSDHSIDFQVLYITIPDADTQGLGFNLSFTWDVPLLEGYKWKVSKSSRGKGITNGYFGLWVKNPMQELGFGPIGIKPDVVFLTGWHFFALVQIYVAAILKRIPVIIRIETNDLCRKSGLLRLSHWLLLRGVNTALAIGKANTRYLLKMGLSPDQIVRSPYHIDNQLFESNAKHLQQSRSRLRQIWGISETTYCFLFAGKLQPKKRPEDLLYALMEILVKVNVANVHILFVGTGELESKCKHIVASRGLPVTFCGFLNQSEIVSAYVASDCLVLPSDSGETWGLVVNEAMACGLPAIVSNKVGCMEDLIVQEKTGLVYPCGNIQALSKAMLFMAENPINSKQMGKNAQHLVTSKYNLNIAKKGVIDAVDIAMASFN